MTLEELKAQRDVLLAARYAGIRTVEIDGRRVTYAQSSPPEAWCRSASRRSPQEMVHRCRLDGGAREAM
jgi:hypothetical protein